MPTVQVLERAMMPLPRARAPSRRSGVLLPEAIMHLQGHAPLSTWDVVQTAFRSGGGGL